MRFPFQDNISGQLPFAANDIARYDNTGLHLRMTIQHGDYLVRLDAITHHFDLIVDPSEIRDFTVGEVARQVTCPVEARVEIFIKRMPEGILDELFRSQVGTTQITASHSGAADV